MEVVILVQFLQLNGLLFLSVKIFFDGRANFGASKIYTNIKRKAASSINFANRPRNDS